MYLKSLTLKGFKSFAQPTTMKLEPGICAIVGPNGSGKSNAVDALAWVMGEQGAKTLRGGKMEDVIFAGAGDKKPLGRAEVTLTIDNSDGALPIAYSEVAITRRMFRDGASEYEINGSKARLMDVQELLSDSGIGREMHVIVGQGRLSQILEAKPEERRAFIEEAAGVLKHRRRKEKAQRKLTVMQTNLDRLGDLTAELRRQLKPLARQAEAAAQASTIQATIRQARMELTAAQIIDLEHSAQAARAEFATATTAAESLNQELEQLQENLADSEAAHVTANQELEHSQELWFALSSLMEKTEATLRISQQRLDSQDTSVHYSGPRPEELEQQAKEVEQHLLELTDTVTHATEALRSVREDVAHKREAVAQADEIYVKNLQAQADRREGIVKLESEQQSLAQQSENIDQELERVQELIEDTAERLTQQKKQVVSAESSASDLLTELPRAEKDVAVGLEQVQATKVRIDDFREQERRIQREITSREAMISLWKEQTELQASPKKVTDLLASHHGDDLKILSQTMAIEHGWERAVSVILGDYASSLVVSPDSEEIASLNEQKISRSSFVIPSSEKRWNLDVALPKGAAWLLDKISPQKDTAAALSFLCAGVVAVDSEKVASKVAGIDSRLSAITPEGVLYGNHVLSVGEPQNTTVELEQSIHANTEQLHSYGEELLDLQASLSGAEEALAQQQTVLARAQAVVQEVKSSQDHAQQQHKQQQDQLERLETELARVTDRRTELEEQKTSIYTAQSDLRARLENFGELDLDYAPSAQEREKLASDLAQAQQEETQSVLALREAESAVEQVTGSAQSLRAQAAHEASAQEQFAQQQRRAQYVREVSQSVHEQSLRVQDRVKDALSRVQVERETAKERRQQLAVQTAELKEALSAVQTRVDYSRQSLQELNMGVVKSELELEQAVNKVTEQYSMDPTELVEQYAPSEDFDEQNVRAELAQAEKTLQTLGKVNPLALEEFEAQEARYKYLSDQLADVEKAKADLIQVIEDVDEAILQLFTDAWHDVEWEFSRVFSTLFPGGEGRLILTDPDDMLHTGIDVEARPPGKRVKRLSLLSGGEKSLTALAMLVAIFRARPSPFYVMDEVEAALDDVNLRRLIALFEELRQDSQLIVITHQKPTMDIANVLYGVTMKADGVTKVISQRMHPEVGVKADA